MVATIERYLRGDAVRAMTAYYARLPELPTTERPALLHGMGYNFEFYDGMFACIAANVQMAMDAIDYTARYQAMQHLLLPFCSEYGIEANRPLLRTHRQLFAEFYQSVAGRAMPQRYDESSSPWLQTSRRWCRKMARTLSCRGSSPEDRARFNLGYFWAIERLSIDEMELMRQAWGRIGYKAAYLEAHCEVEPDHDRWVTRAVSALCGDQHPQLTSAVAAHEAELAGYYRELTRLLAKQLDAVVA